jgi:hypothetical protein
MNNRRTKLIVATACIVFVTLFWPHLFAQVQETAVVTEYITIRWSGSENTHIIRPGGKVEFIGTELRKFKKPGNCDERAFYMNIAMNGLVKEGWEFSGMTSDELVMRRRR